MPFEMYALEPHLSPITVDPADDDVHVRVLGVVVVDRRPLEAPPDVLLDLRHVAAHVIGQIELRGVLGRDDEPELMLLPRAGLLEGRGRSGTLGSVEHALAPVPLDAVPLDVAQVEHGGLGAVLGHFHEARLDDDAA
jgi:hypothetical protein